MSSHFHSDHFNKEMLSWREQKEDIFYLLSKDILKHRRAKADEALFLKKGEIYQDEHLWVKAYGSTDVGVSFGLKINGMNIFHAGDYEAVRNYHKEMGCVCFENTSMGLYFINDPDDYWIEVLPL